MNKVMKHLRVCLIGAFFVFVSGCAFTSYSFKGKHNAPTSIANAGPFVLKSYTFKTDAVHNKSIDMYWCVSSAGARMKKANIESGLVKRYPTLFSKSTNGCPVEVDVRVMTSKEDIYAGMVLFLCSVGTLPLWCGYEDDCEIRVRVGGGEHEIVCPTEKVGYKSCQWSTLYTPIGLFQPESREGYNGQCRFGAAWEMSPSVQCLNDRDDVYCSEVADAVVAALSRCDSDDLKRAVLLRSLSDDDK